MKHASIKVSGKVQGVFFRASTQERALELGVTGFVRNERDGSVYIEAEAGDEILKVFIDWCHVGPAGARVEHVQVGDAPVVGFTKFEIRR